MKLKSLVSYFKENKKRLILSILGIAIGVFSLSLMMGITQAMKLKVERAIGKLGSRVLVILPGEVKNLGGRTVQLSFYPTLKVKDAEEIKKKCPDVEEVSPYKKVSPNVHYMGKRITAEVYGVWPSYSKIADYKPICGRFLSKEDNEEIAQRAVLGYEVAKKLYGEECPVGKVIYLFNAPYRIVGVMEKRGTDLSGENLDERVYIPLSSAVKRISNVDYVDGIYLLPSEGAEIEKVKREVEEFLIKRHGKKDFSVNKFEDLINTQKQAMEIFSKLSLIVSSISFGVGALGILGVMILSVYERLVEIGVKRTFGATRLEIALQFLIESVVLSLIGGIGGALLSSLIVLAVSTFAGWGTFVPLRGALISLLLAGLVGTISGVYPALRASSFDPKEILKET
ncbi:putative ABC transport system permease protein [Thermovibrio guaymasensis]|uniref:Putative ABC transport system permease protein n=1 Tax=Thermovibrio guaymasensis TaxID=240167 RepID=A0A420W900_9BACT|nr:ABC transporter permease [Thermovibrio guaymasensis]RKQ63790.1 putative ABC transport system permease protein [Thermovibrio guaymasensis]